jgi:hypothetical protein
MPQCVGADGLGDPRAAGGPADDPRRTVPVQPAAVSSQEQRPVAALTDGQVDCPHRPWRQRDRNNLAALAGDQQGPVAAFDAQGLSNSVSSTSICVAALSIRARRGAGARLPVGVLAPGDRGGR